MAAPGPWTFCYTTPDGEQACIDIPVLIKWPWEIDQPDPVILDQLGRLQGLAGEVTDQELRMQLTQALDGAVARAGARLPAEFEFRRAATHDLENGRPDASPLPDVTGLNVIEAWNFLHDAGYDVTVKHQVTGAEDLDGIILAQDPTGGTLDAPPGLVIIWEGLLFQQPPHVPDSGPLPE
jgi:hypothetical protein